MNPPTNRPSNLMVHLYCGGGLLVAVIFGGLYLWYTAEINLIDRAIRQSQADTEEINTILKHNDEKLREALKSLEDTQKNLDTIDKALQGIRDE